MVRDSPGRGGKNVKRHERPRLRVGARSDGKKEKNTLSDGNSGKRYWGPLGKGVKK